MLVTGFGDKMYWQRIWDVGESPMVTQDNNPVTNIFKL